MSKKIDRDFVTKNRSDYEKAALKNARTHQRVAWILIRANEYPSAFFHSYVGLEELIKARKLSESEFYDFEKLVDHQEKAVNLAQVSAHRYGLLLTEKNEQHARKRYPQMREDSIYTRMKPTTNDEYAPTNRYWKKRAKSFFNFLTDELAFDSKD